MTAAATARVTGHVSMTGWLLAFGRPVRWPLAISALCRVVGLTAGIALLGYAAHAVVTAATTGGGAPWTVFGVLVGLAAIKGLFQYLEHYTGHWVAFRALAMLRVFFYERLAVLAPAVTVQRRTGDLLARVTRDIDRLEVFFAHSVVPAVTAVIVPVGVLCYLAAEVDPAVALVTAPFLLLLGAVIPFAGRRTTQRAEGQTVRLGGVMSAHLTDTVGGLREITAYGAENRRRTDLARLDAASGAQHRIVARWASIRAGSTRAAQAGVLIVIVAVGTALGLDSASVAVAVAVTVATFPALEAVDGFAALLGSTRTSLDRVRAIAEEEPAAPEPAPDTVWIPGDGPPEICFHNVDFTYPSRDVRPPALTGVDLTIPAGHTVAIVGPTGSGKSTIGALLARIWDPTAGAVTWDGADMRRIPSAELRRRVTVIDQQPFLLHGTVADNLRLADPAATDEQLWRALHIADLADTVRVLPDGLQTHVGERGAALSGGQCQRLAIARAVVHGGQLLVIDEGTSQLDESTERRVLGRLADAIGDCTVLWITHRHTTLGICDAVLEIDEGRVSAYKAG
ncbi:thiol reductant ABC exporter subunit CydC [Rhodococcus sp. ABRD24]|uniref:thiol reductant ABC exporter subunit CydC n=1 Tax=Rhodococcus sp. ABRD24 TaxID=2507582 RepID=UPI00103C8912|nr:thiol reductant ABC exporter subunit CydC [Rhodococcus sp. ABRD24]QBJ96857.1 thiol reductant ABC exporter subunit CydC [Rhodococcus sp. ABRD24]